MATDQESQRVLRVVPIAAAMVSTSEDDVLITYSLGSCVGVTVWDPRLRHGGLIHCMLPTAKSGHTPDDGQTARYVDSGVGQLLQDMYDRGSVAKSLEIRVAGGANPLKSAVDTFRIGDRNVAMLRKLLWKNGLLIAAERLGGTAPRTMSIEIGTGRVVVRTASAVEEI